jgi:hypothetical protein
MFGYAVPSPDADASQYPNLASLDRGDTFSCIRGASTRALICIVRRSLHFPIKVAFEIRAGRVNAMFTDEVDGKVRVKLPDLSYRLLTVQCDQPS